MTLRLRIRGRTANEWRNIRAFYLFVSPLLIGWVVFLIGPSLYSFYLSFTRYDALTAPVFTGLDNYRTLFADQRFGTALYNTFYFALFFVPCSTILAMLLAMVLNRVQHGKALFRAIFYLPAIIPSVPATVLFVWIFNYNYGLINALLKQIGLPPQPWLTSPDLIKPALILMALWGFGSSMLIFLAGLQAIPREFYEASAIDGASGWHQFWNITLPLLSPTTLYVFIIRLIGAFQVFTTAYLLTNGTGGAKDSALFVVLYLYNQGFKLGKLGYASAIAWVLAVIIIAFTLLSLWISRRWVYYMGEPQEAAA
jgi:multiple sugar transport system permease protein